MAREPYAGLLELQKLGNDIEVDLGIVPKGSYLGGSSSSRSKAKNTNAEVIDTAGHVAEAGEECSRLDVRDSALQVQKEYKEYVSEEECLMRIQEYHSAIMNCSSLGLLAQDLCEAVRKNSQKMLRRLCSKFHSILRTVWDNLKSRGYAVCTRLKKQIDKVEATLLLGVDRLAAWLEQLVNDLLEMSRFIITAFLGFANEIAKIACEKSFSLTEISVKFAPMQTISLEVGGMPLFLPKIQMPEISYKFSPTRAPSDR